MATADVLLAVLEPDAGVFLGAFQGTSAPPAGRAGGAA